MAATWIRSDFSGLTMSECDTAVKLENKCENAEFVVPTQPAPSRKRLIPDRKLAGPRKKKPIPGTTAPSRFLWSAKYQPAESEKLAVPKKKVAELRSWIEKCSGNNRGRILVITGPAGSGKSTAVKVLANEMKISLAEWEYIHSAYSANGENPDYESQPKLFQNFLLRGMRYSNVCESPTEVDENGQHEGSNQILVFVEDFPNFALSEPRKFHDILRNSSISNSNNGLIFCVTENFAGDATMRALFPVDIQEQLAITVIKFNPVTIPTMRKHLRSILSQEFEEHAGGSPVSEKKLQEIVEASQGDLRGALLALQFATEVKAQQTTASKKAPKSAATKVFSNRDESLLLFRAVGRVFYVKRNLSEPQNIVGLPPGNQAKARHPLTHDPEEITDKCPVNLDLYTSFLHENFPFFITNLSDYQKAAETMSVSDLITSEWSVAKSAQPYAASVAVRGLLYLKTGKEDSKATFHQFTKPFSIDANKTMQQRIVDGRRFSEDASKTSRCATMPLFTDQIPYAARILPLQNSSAMHKYLRELSKFGGARDKCKFLTEKESLDVELQIDDFQPECECVESRPESLRAEEVGENLQPEVVEEIQNEKLENGMDAGLMENLEPELERKNAVDGLELDPTKDALDSFGPGIMEVEDDDDW